MGSDITDWNTLSRGCLGDDAGLWPERTLRGDAWIWRQLTERYFKPDAETDLGPDLTSDLTPDAP